MANYLDLINAEPACSRVIKRFGIGELLPIVIV